MDYTISAKPGGSWDVIVCGGGTAGWVAAVAAAREGARTLLIERTFTVGGMLTLGEAGITKFTEHCRDVNIYKREVLDVLAKEPRSVQVVGGIPHEYALRMLQSGYAVGTHGEAGSYVFTDRCGAQWTMMDMLKAAGVEVLYDTRICMAVKTENQLTSVVAVNKEGFVEYSAKCFVDATGDADVAALSGVTFHVGASEADIAEGCAAELGQMHAFGTMFRVRGVDFHRLFTWLKAAPHRFVEHQFGVMSIENVTESYEHGEMCVFRVLIDLPDGRTGPVQVYNLPAKDEAILLGPYCGCTGSGLDTRDLSRGQETLQAGARRLMALLSSCPGFESARITYVPDVGVRETRHIRGMYVLTGMDVLKSADFPDSIACGGHPVDIHPLPPDVEHMPMHHWRFHIPYRIMVPEAVQGLLVTGRCVSATRMASGSLRPTAQCMAMGEAAGVAAAICAREGITPSAVDGASLSRIMISKGAIV